MWILKVLMGHCDDLAWLCSFAQHELLAASRRLSRQLVFATLQRKQHL